MRRLVSLPLYCCIFLARKWGRVDVHERVQNKMWSGEAFTHCYPPNIVTRISMSLQQRLSFVGRVAAEILSVNRENPRWRKGLIRTYSQRRITKAVKSRILHTARSDRFMAEAPARRRPESTYTQTEILIYETA